MKKQLAISAGLVSLLLMKSATAVPQCHNNTWYTHAIKNFSASQIIANTNSYIPPTAAQNQTKAVNAARVLTQTYERLPYGMNQTGLTRPKILGPSSWWTGAYHINQGVKFAVQVCGIRPLPRARPDRPNLTVMPHRPTSSIAGLLVERPSRR